MDYIKKYNKLSKENNLLPIKVSKFYQKKIKEEIKHVGLNGPLYRVSYPTKEKTELRVSGEVKDWVDDRINMQGKYGKDIIKKYDNRVLVLVTQICTGHCLYCFRQDILSEKLKINESINFISLTKNLLDLIKSDGNIKEIILSGGDPITLGAKRLEFILDLITSNSNIKNIRIHSRAIVYSPQLFTKELIKVLSKYNVRLVFHINHPYEICETIKKYINKIQKHGIRCYNQFPLLRNINDNWLVLSELLSILDELNIRNLSIFIPDPIIYSGAYRIDFKRVIKIIDDLNFNASSWVNSTRFILDTVYGKVRRENIESFDNENQTIIFNRNGKKIIYPDFPEKFDKPGDIRNMLWKNYK